MVRQLLPAIALALTSVMLSACTTTSSSLRGVVVEGRSPGVYLVSADDPRLKRYPVEDALVEVVVNPKDIRPERFESPPTLPDGEFSIDPTVFGAGFLQYDLGIFARARGYGDVWGEPQWPGSNQRILIIMAPGRPGALRRPGSSEVDEMMKYLDKPTGQ